MNITGHRTRAARWAALAAVTIALGAHPAMAALPTTSLIDGVLLSSGGSAAADGDYDMVLAVYDAATGGTATWSETAKVKVVGGRFSHALGSVSAIEPAKLAALQSHWIGIKIASDPELPRQKLHAALFAVVAGEAGKLSCQGCVSSDHVANGGIAAAKVGFNFAGSSTKGGPAGDVECTGCVNVADMKFDGDVDLAGNSLKGKNATFSGTVAAAEFVGDGSKLTGLKTPAGECKVAGEVVKGINTDGTLKCIAALDPAALPKDGLNEISNNLLSNQFTDTINGGSGIAIPDNTGTDGNSTLDFPDIGTTQDFELYVEVKNTDLSSLALTILPPDDKKVGWTLCDPCGEKDKKDYKATFNSSALPKSGDLKKWIGGNPKGTWNLKALDTSFCVVQAPGNAGICDPAKATDGTIVKWHIKIQTLSNKKINNNGDLYVSGKVWGADAGHGKAGGDLKLGSGLQLGKASAACDAQGEGTFQYDSSTGIPQVCSSGTWVNLAREICWGSVTQGICFQSPGAGNPSFIDGAEYCAARKSDICSDSQVWVLRQTGALWSNAIWTNSFADNDGGQWNEANGGTGDDHGSGSGWTAPCCYNVTPPRKSDEVIGGVRVVYKHDNPSVYFRQAAMYCAGLEADLCSKSEYQVLRQANYTNPNWGYWASDHSDNDNEGFQKGIGPVADNPSLGHHYGFVCCGSHRKTLACPAPHTDHKGICVTKVHNADNADWNTAAHECTKLNSRLCSIAQTAVLRKHGIVSSSSSWTASYSDNDSGHAAIGVGSAGDDHPPSSTYGYACCLW